MSWSLLDAEVRRCQTKQFPYGIIYTIENDDIIIIAVAHLHREPEYWKARIALLSLMEVFLRSHACQQSQHPLIKVDLG